VETGTLHYTLAKVESYVLVQQLVNRFKELKAETLGSVKSEAKVDTVSERLAEVEVETPLQHTG